MEDGEFRTETDELGDIEVPADAYWGAHTERARENFQISGLTFDRRFIRALGIAKKASARANRDLGFVPERKAEAIVSAADEVIDGQHDDQFPVDVFQTGSGTSTNMNANEVVANRVYIARNRVDIMTFDPDRVRVISFDSFSTLVDPRSASAAIEEYVDDPETVALQWHTLAVRFATVANYIDSYRTYYELHRDAIQHLLETRGITVSDEKLDEITGVYHDLEPFGDVRDEMERLDAAGYDLAILSNGDPELLESLLRTADITDLVSETISADEIELFKPASDLYEHAATRLDTPIGDIAHVGAGWMDIMGCTHAGMQGVWIDRQNTPWPPFDGTPDLTIDSLHELTDRVTE